ncbi:MAG: hypothetical protein ACLQPH_04130 [Acidimicrobiales bacterium]
MVSATQCKSANVCHDDHIFPKDVYARDHPVDRIMNRAFIRKQCNNQERAKKPRAFFDHCLEGHAGDQALLLATLDSHLISPESYRALLEDAFDGSVKNRRASVTVDISKRISPR